MCTPGFVEGHSSPSKIKCTFTQGARIASGGSARGFRFCHDQPSQKITTRVSDNRQFLNSAPIYTNTESTVSAAVRDKSLLHYAMEKGTPEDSRWKKWLESESYFYIHDW